MNISIVVALSQNNCIGLNNTLPWRQSADLKQFKAITTGHPLIVGRKTYESIGKPLPNRKTIVVTSQKDWLSGHADVVVVHSLDDALSKAKELAKLMGVTSVMLVGGGNLYKQALPIADTLFVTHINAVIEGDAFFPDIKSSEWEKIAQQDFSHDEKNQYDYQFCKYARQAST